ncbi:ABC transporter permease [Fulvivirga lutea]|uniref:ABC transporter permease n=1 Tax=Fulvivirga lutea TaxID=2810512 RepID=A0A974WE38_9BACT|nr:ABC transporter permease [Fulvivirga lutea]QSE95869.1 ABC transporter permease [Fulvivirga lutea]
MVKNSIRLIVRLLAKNKAHTLINILGLSIGVSAVILVALIINFNLNFDKFHDNTESIYRLVQHHVDEGRIGRDSATPFPLRLNFKDDNPQVEYFTMVDGNNTQGLVSLMRNGNKVKYEEDDRIQVFVQPDYFKIFHVDFLLGDKEHALDEPYTVVISKNLAQKYFGEYSLALGKVLKIDNVYDLTVTGIIDNPPLNTDLPFEMLISFSTDEKNRAWESWTASSTTVNSFIKLVEGTNVESFEKQVVNYIEDRKEESDPTVVQLALQPFEEIHHDDRYFNYGERVATYHELLAMAIIGLLLLITACINFINLNTAFAVKRSKEIGIKKVLGGSKSSIQIHYLLETGIITLVSIVIGLGLAELILFRIDEIIGYRLPGLEYNLNLLALLSTLLIVVTLLAGIYPSWIISRFSPIQALKNKMSTVSGSGLSLRRVLIVSQILVSQFLIIAVIVVHEQVEYFIQQPLGIDTEAIVEFRIPTTDDIDFGLLGERINRIDGVESVTFSNTGTASTNTWGGTASFNNGDETINTHMQVKLADSSYLSTYGIKLIAGRNISNNDSIRSYLLNEKAVQDLGVTNEEILGRKLNVWGKDGIVIGVIENFATMSLHNSQRPIALWYAPSMHFRGTVKLRGGDWKTTINQVQNEWEVFFGDYFFNYYFLDDEIENFYKEEQRLAKTFGMLSGVAVFIGVIGLLGLMSYMVNSKMKEIGIRKVLGAKVSQILALLSADFVKLSLIAFVIAAPIGWYIMNSWLEDFAFRITIGVQVFAVALGVSLFFTLITISYKSLKAANVNPVDVLKDE